jgi:hypothetical protein
MSNLFYPLEDESDHTAKDGPSMWDEVRQIADELKLKIHLASMDARDRWRTLEPRLTAIENDLASSGERAGQVVTKELSAICAALQRLRAEILGGGSHA